MRLSIKLALTFTCGVFATSVKAEPIFFVCSGSTDMFAGDAIEHHKTWDNEGITIDLASAFVTTGQDRYSITGQNGTKIIFEDKTDRNLPVEGVFDRSTLTGETRIQYAPGRVLINYFERCVLTTLKF